MNILIGVVVVLVFVVGYLHNKINKLEKHTNTLLDATCIHDKWICETEVVTKYCLFRLGNYDINTFKQSLENYPTDLLNQQFKNEIINMADSFVEWAKEQEELKKKGNKNNE